MDFDSIRRRRRANLKARGIKQPRLRRPWYYVHGTHNGQPYVGGPYGSNEEAEAIKMKVDGYAVVETFPTRDRNEVTRELRHRNLAGEGGTVDSALARRTHTIPKEDNFGY